MSNVLDKNPMVIDTAGAGVLISSKIYPMSVRWDGATTAGHQAEIKDKDGNLLWASRCGAGSTAYAEAEQIDARKPWNGMIVPTLGSGRLIITLKHDPLP